MSRRNIINLTTDVSQVRRRHRPLDIGAALADNKTSYFILGRQEKCLFGQKLPPGFLTIIFEMSNIVGQPIKGPFGRPDKSF